MYEINEIFMEQEPIRIVMPDADVFLLNLGKLLTKIDDIYLDIISKRLGITKEEAKELIDKMKVDGVWGKCLKEQIGELRFLCTK